MRQSWCLTCRSWGLATSMPRLIGKLDPAVHGYDVVDPVSLNPELGGEKEYGRLVEALEEYEMGQLLDFVPNHMGVGSDNAWWSDMLENGPASAYAAFFDID